MAPGWLWGCSRPGTLCSLAGGPFPRTLGKEQETMGMGWTYNAWVVAGSSQASSNPFSCSQRPPACRDSCPPERQGQGGARVTHHSLVNQVGLVAFLMIQGGCARSYCRAQKPAVTHLPHCWFWGGGNTNKSSEDG